jgi:hypothetical protein
VFLFFVGVVFGAAVFGMSVFCIAWYK